MNIIIVLNYNDYENTKKFIKYSEHYNILDKIIIVDNNSTDDSYKILKQLENEKIDVIKNNKNNGYSGGNNYGIKYAENKYNPKNIIISNPDIEVEEKTIIKLINELEKNDKLAVITGVICEGNNDIVSNFAWKVPNYGDILRGCFLSTYKIHRKFSNSSMYYESKDITNNKILNVEVVPGCFFVIKDKIIREIGYLDEEVFLFYEENILAKKLKELRYQTAILCDEKIIHLNSVSINKNIKKWKNKQKILEESTIIYLEKYLHLSKFKINIFKILFGIGKYERRILGKIREYKK